MLIIIALITTVIGILTEVCIDCTGESPAVRCGCLPFNAASDYMRHIISTGIPLISAIVTYFLLNKKK